MLMYNIEVTKTDHFINTLYTVSGIMFSIGFGLVVTFNMQGVKNQSYIRKIRSNINEVRNSYLSIFAITTLFYVCESFLRDNKLNLIKIWKFNSFNLTIDIYISTCLFILLSITYYIFNFLSIQSLNNEIFDKLNDK